MRLLPNSLRRAPSLNRLHCSAMISAVQVSLIAAVLGAATWLPVAQAAGDGDQPLWAAQLNEPPTPTLSAQLVEADQGLSLELSAQDTGRLLQSMPAPAMAANADDTSLTLLAVTGGKSFALLRVSAPSEPARQYWEVVFELTGSGRGPSANPIWHSRRSENQPGEQIRWVADRERGGPAMIADIAHPTINACAESDWWLAPRRWDTARRRFEPLVAAPSAQGAVALRPDDMPQLVDHVLSDAHFTHVSSEARSSLFVSYRRIDDSLVDRDPGTGWRAGGSGFGHGEFLVGRVQPEVELTAVSLFVPDRDDISVPSAALLQTSSGQLYQLEGFNKGTLQTWSLPTPEVGPCVALALLGPHATRAKPLGLAMAHLHTTIDDLSLAEALDNVLLPLLHSVWLGVDQQRAVEMIVSMGVPALDPLFERLMRTQGEEQAALLPAILQIEGGRRRLLDALQDMPISAAAGRELSRRGVLDELDSASTIIARMLQAYDEEQLQAQLRMLARSVPAELAIVSLPFLGSPDEQTQGLALRVLQRIKPEQIPALLAIGEVLPEAHQAELLNALAAAAGRVRSESIFLEEDDRELIRRYMVHDNSVIARRTLRLLAHFQDGELLSDLELLVLTDPHPRLRAEATEALSRYREEVWNARITLTLVEAAADDSPIVRLYAARALTHPAFAHEAGDALVELWQRETWPDTRRALIQALLTLADPDIDAQIHAAIPQMVTRDAISTLRAVQNRGRPISAAHVDEIYEASPNAPSLRAALVQTIASQGSPETDAWLSSVFERERDLRVLAAMLEAVGRRNIVSLQDQVGEALNHEDPGIRRAAARGFATNRSPESRAMLEARARIEEVPAVLETIELVLEAQNSNSRLDEIWRGAQDQLLNDEP